MASVPAVVMHDEKDDPEFYHKHLGSAIQEMTTGIVEVWLLKAVGKVPDVGQ